MTIYQLKLQASTDEDTWHDLHVGEALDRSQTSAAIEAAGYLANACKDLIPPSTPRHLWRTLIRRLHDDQITYLYGDRSLYDPTRTRCLHSTDTGDCPNPAAGLLRYPPNLLQPDLQVCATCAMWGFASSPQLQHTWVPLRDFPTVSQLGAAVTANRAAFAEHTAAAPVVVSPGHGDENWPGDPSYTVDCAGCDWRGPNWHPSLEKARSAQFAHRYEQAERAGAAAMLQEV